MASKIDWEGVEKEYRAGALSIRAIAKLFGCSDAAVRKKAKQQGWERDLSKRVRAQTKSALVRERVRTPEEIAIEEQTDLETIADAANRNMAVVLSHRVGLEDLKSLAVELLKQGGAELRGDPDGVIHYTEVDGRPSPIYRGQRESIADIMKKVGDILAKVIPLERTAFGLDDETGDDERDDLTMLLDELSGGSLGPPRLRGMDTGEDDVVSDKEVTEDSSGTED